MNTNPEIRIAPPEAGPNVDRPEANGRWKKRETNRRDDGEYLAAQEAKQQLADEAAVREAQISAKAQAGRLSPPRRGAEPERANLSVHEQGVNDGKWGTMSSDRKVKRRRFRIFGRRRDSEDSRAA
ncbi:hypothetical protein KJ766_00880 [Patescibacteria group bacterium]|nr:hypothetical protein [Patescibacteria group bacterium]